MGILIIESNGHLKRLWPKQTMFLIWSMICNCAFGVRRCHIMFNLGKRSNCSLDRRLLHCLVDEMGNIRCWLFFTGWWHVLKNLLGLCLMNVVVYVLLPLSVFCDVNKWKWLGANRLHHPECKLLRAVLKHPLQTFLYCVQHVLNSWE